MQFQTTTVSTQQQTVDNTAFQITTFEQKISVFCDCCDNQSHGTREELKNRGWSFGGGSEFCPEHY